MSILADMEKRAQEMYEHHLREAYPDRKARAYRRLIDSAVNAQRLHVMLWGRPMTDDEFARWMRGKYDVKRGSAC